MQKVKLKKNSNKNIYNAKIKVNYRILLKELIYLIV